MGRENVKINGGIKGDIYGVGSAGAPWHCRAWLGLRVAER